MENVDGTQLRNNSIYIASVLGLSLSLSFSVSLSRAPIDAYRKKEYLLLEFISSCCLLPFEARNLFFPPVVKFLMGEKGKEDF